MANKEKEIEQMAMSIAECNGISCDNCRRKCEKYITCEILYEKGYRNGDDARKETAEDICNTLLARIGLCLEATETDIQRQKNDKDYFRRYEPHGRKFAYRQCVDMLKGALRLYGVDTDK